MEERSESPFKRVGTYDLYTCIGQGSFATVYRGQHRTTKRVVAVKAIVRSRLNQKLQENLEAEISIMKSLSHPNVVQLFEVQTTDAAKILGRYTEGMVREVRAGHDLAAI